MNTFNYNDLRKYVGNINQVAGIRHFEYKDGKAKNVEAYEIKSGAGLEYTVLADRGLDISRANYEGTNFSYLSNNGVVSPAYFEEEGTKTLRSFIPGLLTTCGLTYYGVPDKNEDGRTGLHGRISNIPGEEISINKNLKDDEPYISVSGKIRQASFFGEYIIMERKIKSLLGKNKIVIKDSITNEGFEKQPFMILYHVNFGYPFLDEGAEIIAPIDKVIPSTEHAKKGIEEHYKVEKPQMGYKEKVYYLDLIPGRDGSVTIGMINKKLGFGVYEKFNKEEFPRFIQWKQMGKGYYVMGLEPCTNYFEGRAQEREKGRLEYIKPGETKDFELELGIIEQNEIENYIKKINNM